MKKIKLLLFVALFGAMSFGAFSAYDYVTMSADEKALLKNVEALTSGEEGGGGFSVICYDKTQYAGGSFSQYNCLTLTDCYFQDKYSAALNSKSWTCTNLR